MTARTAAALSTVAAALALTGCGADSEPADYRPLANYRPGDFTLKIVAPQNGAVVESSDVEVRVEVTGIKIADAEHFATPDTELAHLHLIMDEGKLDDAEHSPATAELVEKEQMSERNYSPVGSETATYKNIPPGQHHLRASLVTNDHSGPVTLTDDVSIDFSVKK